MYKEMAGMTNEEMFTAIIERMDSMESGLTGLGERIDRVEFGLSERIDKLHSDMNMEFWAVRTEMNGVNESLKRDISILNDKVDRLMYTKDVDGYEKMKIQVDVLTQGYQELKEKIG